MPGFKLALVDFWPLVGASVRRLAASGSTGREALLGLVGASVCRSARCAGVLGVPEACRLGAPLVVGAVEVAAPLLTAFFKRSFAPGPAL